MWIKVWHRERWDGRLLTRRIHQDHGTRGNSFTVETDTHELNRDTLEKKINSQRRELQMLREMARGPSIGEDDEIILPDWKRDKETWAIELAEYELECAFTNPYGWDRCDIWREEDYCWSYLYDDVYFEEDIMSDDDEWFHHDEYEEQEEFENALVRTQAFWDSLADGTIDAFMAGYAAGRYEGWMEA